MPAIAAELDNEVAPAPLQPTMSPWLTFMFAAATGLVGANLYYGQPLAGLISHELGFSPASTGLIVTLTQIGYAIGLLLIVPLGDLLENRRLVLSLVVCAAIALSGAVLAPSPALFLIAALCIGLGSVAVQVLVPFAAHMAPDASRGRVVGNVMSGLLCGIMLARPFASFVSEASSWRTVYIISAVLMIALAVILRLTLPSRMPHTRMRYAELLRSMGQLALHNRLLQRRAIYQSCMFAAFSVFWTTTPLLLASPAFGLSQNGIALFALAGAAGAVASPIAGRMADRGLGRLATGSAMALAIVALLLAHESASGSTLALVMLTLSGILLDFGVQTNLVVGQRSLFALSGEHRARLNGLYMATFFCGGAFGSAIGGWAYAEGGWSLTSWIGIAFPVIALLIFATERQSAKA